MAKKRRVSKPGALEFLFQRQLPLESETTTFILVSALDIFMTWFLLSQGGFIESNPVARFFLDRWGKYGFVGFKFAAVSVVCVVVQVIALQRLELARKVLQLGTVVVFFVVIYSLALFVRYGNL